MKKNLFLAAVALLALAACSNNEENAPAAPAQLQVTAGLGSDAATRGDGEVTWASSAKIVVNAVGNSNGDINGLSWENQSGAITKAYFTPSSDNDKYTFAEDATVKFTAVTYNTTDLPSVFYKAVAVSVTNGNAPENLYFAGPVEATSSNPIVNFVFKHAMAKLTIKTLQKEDGVSDISSAVLSGYYNSGSLNLNDGTVTGTAGDATVTLTNPTSADNTYVIIPSASKQTLKLTVTAGRKTYVANIKNTFESNKIYTYTITLTKTKLEFVGNDGTGSEDSSNGCTIKDWPTDEITGTADASMANNK